MQEQRKYPIRSRTIVIFVPYFINIQTVEKVNDLLHFILSHIGSEHAMLNLTYHGLATLKLGKRTETPRALMTKVL